MRMDGEGKAAPLEDGKDKDNKVVRVIRLNTVTDSEGNEREVAPRKHQDEELILDQIYDILSATGFLETNYRDVAPFEKIVRGTIACLRTFSSYQNVDLPVGFEKEMHIKEKIKISEFIIKFLLSKEIRCPVVLQPHQIMGLDVEKILPLIRWLAKNFAKYSKPATESYKMIGNAYFDSHFDGVLGAEAKHSESNGGLILLSVILRVLEKYSPTRARGCADPNRNLEDHDSVNIVFYGADAECWSRDRARTIEDVLHPVEEYRTRDRFCDDIDRDFKRERYEFLQSDLDEWVRKAKNRRDDFDIEALLEEEDDLIRSVDDLEADIKAVREEISEVEVALEEANARERDPKFVRFQTIIDETKKMREEYSKLCAANEELESKGSRKEDVESKIAELRDQTEQCEGLQKRLERKIDKIKLKIAHESKIIAQLESELDEPGSAELAMYYLRFQELYDEVDELTNQTKNYYDAYNTLIDLKEFKNKEINLWNSVLENYQRAMSSSHYREQFSAHLDSVIEWANQTERKLDNALAQKKRELADLTHELDSLYKLEEEYKNIVKKLTAKSVAVAGKMSYNKYKRWMVDLDVQNDTKEVEH